MTSRALTRPNRERHTKVWLLPEGGRVNTGREGGVGKISLGDFAM